MFKFLRIACALIAAALAAVCVLVGVFTESLWAAIGVAAGAALFFALCLLFKYLQEEQEEKAAKARQAQSSEDAAQNSEGAAAEVQPSELNVAQAAQAGGEQQTDAAAAETKADEQNAAPTQAAPQETQAERGKDGRDK